MTEEKGPSSSSWTLDDALVFARTLHNYLTRSGATRDDAVQAPQAAALIDFLTAQKGSSS